MRRSYGLLGRFQHPAQVIVTGFAAVALIGTALLASPIATESGESAGA